VVFSEADGTFTIDGLPPGPVKIDVSAPERESHVLNVGPSRARSRSRSRSPRASDRDRGAPGHPQDQHRQRRVDRRWQGPQRVSAQTLDDAMQGKLAARIYSRTPAPPRRRAAPVARHLDHQRSVVAAVRDRRVIISNVTVQAGTNADLRRRGAGVSSTQDNSANRSRPQPERHREHRSLEGASAAALYGSKGQRRRRDHDQARSRW